MSHGHVGRGPRDRHRATRSRGARRQERLAGAEQVVRVRASIAPRRPRGSRAPRPQGSILAAWVGDLGVKEALLADAPEIYFTTPHFDGYRLVLARLDRMDPTELTELVVDAWVTRAPQRLAAQYLDTHGPPMP